MTPASPTPPRRRPIRLHLILAPFAVGGAVVTVMAFLGGVHWAVDLTSHFRVQYLAGLAALALAYGLLRQWRWAGLCLAFALVNAAEITPYLLPGKGDGDGGERLRVAAVNVRTENTRADLVVAYLRAERPDVVVLAETDDAWEARLRPAIAAEYPCAHFSPRGDNFGIAVLARRPCVARDVPLGGEGLPSYLVRIAAGRDSVTVVATHPLPPNSAGSAAARDRQLSAAAYYLAGIRGTKLLVGDLNATPWSSPFRALLRRTGMRDASDGRGVHATWPADGALLRIPIDHVVTSPGVAVDAVRVGAPIGSDHLPLTVDLRVP